MLSVWVKTGGVVLIIAIGYIMKKTGSLPESAAKILTKIMVKVTLPCVFICNLNGLTISKDMTAALLWGLGVEVALIAWFGLIPFGAVREAMIIAMFAPLPTSAPAMALNFGYKDSAVAFGASATLIVSIIMTSIVCAMLF